MGNLDLNKKLSADVESKEFSVPPIGEYNFMVVSADLTYSKAGNPMFKVRLDLQGADGCVWDNLLCTEEAEWKLHVFFESIGLKEKGKESSLSISEAFEKAPGCEGRCKIKHGTYNGKTRAEVDRYIVTESKKADKKPKGEMPEINEDELPFEI